MGTIDCNIFVYFSPITIKCYLMSEEDLITGPPRRHHEGGGHLSTSAGRRQAQ